MERCVEGLWRTSGPVKPISWATKSGELISEAALCCCCNKNIDVNTKIQFQIRLFNLFSGVQENSHCAALWLQLWTRTKRIRPKGKRIEHRIRPKRKRIVVGSSLIRCNHPTIGHMCLITLHVKPKQANEMAIDSTCWKAYLKVSSCAFV